LRRLRNDSAKAKGVYLELRHLPIKIGKLNETAIVEALKTIQSSEKRLWLSREAVPKSSSSTRKIRYSKNQICSQDLIPLLFYYRIGLVLTI
jgi:hypothetical protein